MKIRSSNWKIALAFTAATVVWLGLSTTLFVLKLRDGMQFGCAFLFIGFFVLFGLLLGVWTLSHIFRWVRFKDSHLEFAEEDARVGGPFSAMLWFAHPFRPTGAMVLNPRCIRHDVYRSRTSTQESDRSSTVTVLWRNESTVELSEAQTRGPVAITFPLPSGYPAATDPTLDSSIHWQLEVTVPSRFVDFHSTFEIPVRGEGAPDGCGSSSDA
ncbi:MAG: hypothetical protein ABI779_21040 [Acidobacteriota bacterium]